MKRKFSIIIPTYKRKDDLQICLQSIFRQTHTPDEVIIVDDDSLPEYFIKSTRAACEKHNIALIYHKKDHTKTPRGSAESRNIGIELVNNEIFFILDDDLILDDHFFAYIMDAWRNTADQSCIGIGGVITNNRKRGTLEAIYSNIFGLGSQNDWDVNTVAFQSWNDWITKQQTGYYVHGGVCSYKKDLVQTIGGFATFSGGRTALEDVDFCLQAKQKGYHFLIEPLAKVIHNHSPSGRENHFLAGYKEAQNRKSIFRLYCKKSLGNRLVFIWAHIGWILKQFVTCQFKKGVGMLVGLIRSQK